MALTNAHFHQASAQSPGGSRRNRSGKTSSHDPERPDVDGIASKNSNAMPGPSLMFEPKGDVEPQTP